MAQMNNNQMNNNQMNNRNMQANKPMENHSWAIKELTRNDVLATNQWPIKVVRDEGKQTKMEIRSITDLNNAISHFMTLWRIGHIYGITITKDNRKKKDNKNFRFHEITSLIV